MPDLADGESTHMKGSAATPYELKNMGGVYSCSCPAWRNQSVPIERRTCKHLKKLRGEAEELARVGGAAATPVHARHAEASAPAREQEDAEGEESDKGPPVLLAHKWDGVADLSGWWMSEKLDGVRAYWDGKQFISRLGNPYHAPDWFMEGLPKMALDGELFGGRKHFQNTVSVVRRQDKSDHWKQIRYVIFDAPALAAPFEERMELFTDHIAKHKPAYAVAHPHERCKGIDHLRAELKRVEGLGGEGLMLRQPGSRYEVGRSFTLLKVKTFHDAEAKVVGHLDGTGKHKGRLGALEVEMPDGTRFHVGTGFSEQEREHPPAVGSTVTYHYQELSDKGVPRFPSFVRVRRDP